jgi:hypothetical protein
MLNLKTLFTGTSLALACLSVMAQSATPRVDQREARQDQRIENGVASGELNAKETYRLEQPKPMATSVRKSAATCTKCKTAPVATSTAKSTMRKPLGSQRQPLGLS